eukprot:365956-Chlamydomonas_euryale.AAC.12
MVPAPLLGAPLVPSYLVLLCAGMQAFDPPLDIHTVRSPSMVSTPRSRAGVHTSPPPSPPHTKTLTPFAPLRLAAPVSPLVCRSLPCPATRCSAGSLSPGRGWSGAGCGV